MKRIVFVIFVSSLLVALASVQKGSIPAVKASSSIYQGDLILNGNNVTTIEGVFEINGSIIVEENATLILRNTLLNFTQVKNYQFNITLGKASNGQPRLTVENATFEVAGYLFAIALKENSSASANEFTADRTGNSVHLYAYDYSHLSISNSKAPYAHARICDNSRANVTDSSLFEINGAGDPNINQSNVTLSYLYAAENSNMNVSDSAVNISVETHLDSANFSASGLHPVYVNYWNPYHNHSISVASQGWVPNLTLIDTDVRGWEFVFFGSSNVTILESELFGLVSDDSSVVTLSDSVISVSIYSYGSSRFNLYDTATERLRVSQNATASLTNSTCEVYQIYDLSKVRVSWYLDVSVFDSIGQDVPSANVTASFPNATVAESKLTDANGRVKLLLLEKMMNTTGEYPVGNYTVEATYDIYVNATTVNMTESQQITLALEDFVVPEFPSLIILALFMAATLLAATIHRRKNRRL